jgi:prevent-host-death family protein
LNSDFIFLLKSFDSLHNQTRLGLLNTTMSIINIQAAKTHLSRLVDQAAQGEEIILAKAGKPLVKLVPVKAQQAPRVGGQLKGKIRESADCWEPDANILELDSSLLPGEDSATTRKAYIAAESPAKYGTASKKKKAKK